MKTLILLFILGIMAMLSEIFNFRKYLWYLVVAGLAAAFFLNFTDWNMANDYFPEMMKFDRFAANFSGLLILLAFIWFLIGKDQYESEGFNVADHYSLILFTLVGTVVMVSFSHLSMLFLGIEIISIPMYVLAGSKKNSLSSNEAAIKYFMMGAFATGILLFGIALVYGATGTFNIYEIAGFVNNSRPQAPLIFSVGVLLVLIGLCFKVSAVPFHFWTPDVYDGAPNVITAFMATIIKTAAFAGFYRLFSNSFGAISDFWGTTLSLITIVTILAGNILAVYQDSVKRMLAYSGVSQAGYLLLTLLVLNPQSEKALLLYLASYAISTLAAFSVLFHVVKTKGDASIESFKSLGKTNPLLATVMTVAMLSLAGIPPAIGFFAKFYLFSIVLNEGYLALVLVAVLGSLISVYYYFKVIISMYSGDALASTVKIGPMYKLVLILVTGLIILLGITPGLLIDQI